jgi:DNA-binding beta-propeller fold protein YncE
MLTAVRSWLAPPQRRAGVLVILALSASLVAGAAHAAKGVHARARAVLLVANSYDGTVDLLDARTFRLLGKPLDVIPEGPTPVDPVQRQIYPGLIQNRGEVNLAQEVAASPDGRTIYVSRGYLGDVAAFALGTHKERWRAQLPALRADHLTVTPDGTRLFVSALPGSKVYALNAATGRIEGSYEAGDWPHVLEISPDGKYVYSGSLGNQLLPFGHDSSVHQLTVADAGTLRVVRSYRFDAGVRPFAFVPHTHELVLQLSYLNGFVAFDLLTGSKLRTVDLPLSAAAMQLRPQDYPNQAAHHGIAVSLDGRTVCDAGTISGYVAMVRLTGGRAAKIIPVGATPAEALTSLDGRYCYVISRGPTGLNRAHVRGLDGDTLSVISYAHPRELARVRVGIHPQAEAEVPIPETVLRAGGFLK